MDIHKLLNLKGSAPSKIDEAVYELIAHELSSNQVKQGLWTKALADSEWNESKAKSIYVKMRHSQLIDEIRDSRQKSYNPAILAARQDAFEYGLTNEEIDYLPFEMNKDVYFQIVFDADSRQIIVYKDKNWKSPTIHQCTGNFYYITDDLRVWLAANSLGENVEVSNFEIETGVFTPKII